MGIAWFGCYEVTPSTSPDEVLQNSVFQIQYSEYKILNTEFRPVSRIQDSELYSGHITPIENSSAFNEAITNFLKGTHF